MSRIPSLIRLAGFSILLISGCSDSTSPATGTLDAVSPAPAAAAVATSTAVALTFGQPMMAGMEQYVDLHQGGITGPVVPMNCAWSPDGTTLTCTPTNPLAPGTQFTIHCGAGVSDARGHMMDFGEWTTMGGQWVTNGMMGGMHDGQMVGMMGPGWKHGSHYGMMFSFTTA